MSTKYKVVFSRRALESLKSISDYLIENSSPEIAKAVPNGLKSAASSLQKFPYRRSIFVPNESSSKQVRSLKKWSFHIFFSVDESLSIVKILVIKHEKENPEELIKDI